MIRALAVASLRLFPGAWRMRYEEEVRLLLEDHPAGLSDLVSLLRGAVHEWSSQLGDPTSRPFAAALWMRGWGAASLTIALQMSSGLIAEWLRQRGLDAPAWTVWASDVAIVGLVIRVSITSVYCPNVVTGRWRKPMASAETRVWWAILIAAIITGNLSAARSLHAWQFWFWFMVIGGMQASSPAAWELRRARDRWLALRNEHRDRVKGYLQVPKLVAAGRIPRADLDELGREIANLNEQVQRAAVAHRTSYLCANPPPARPRGL